MGEFLKLFHPLLIPARDVFLCPDCVSNHIFHLFIDCIVAPGLQVMTGGTRHILNPRRRYYQILNQFTKEGIDSGKISFPGSYKELSEQIASLQRGLTYDWCLNEQRYSLLHRGNQIVSGYLYSLKSPDSGQHSRSV